jgi:PRTRC genetic system ThiF family protein
MRKTKHPAKKKTEIAPSLDSSYANSVRVKTAGHNKVHIIMIGCGGTGSCLSGPLARLIRVIKEGGTRSISALFIDPDVIEEKNIGRQNFCDAEIGYPKAQTLAARCNRALGLEIEALNKPFSANDIDIEYEALTVMVGCVDNSAARREIALTLHKRGRSSPPRLWWLDCGNSKDSGQVLLGSTNDMKALEEALVFGESLCQHLPSPALQAPTLLEPRPEEIENQNLSCAELALLNAQGLIVNQRVAVEAADFLTRLLLYENLERYATYFDLPSGSAKSLYITREEINKFVVGTQPQTKNKVLP